MIGGQTKESLDATNKLSYLVLQSKKEVSELIEVGFEYVTEMDSVKLF